MAAERPWPGQAALMLVWNGDGSYTPRCVVCGFEGKARVTRDAAFSGLDAHRVSARHRRRQVR